MDDDQPKLFFVGGTFHAETKTWHPGSVYYLRASVRRLGKPWEGQDIALYRDLIPPKQKSLLLDHDAPWVTFLVPATEHKVKGVSALQVKVYPCGE